MQQSWPGNDTQPKWGNSLLLIVPLETGSCSWSVTEPVLTNAEPCCCCYCLVNKPRPLCDSLGCSVQASLSFVISRSLLKFRSFESVMLSNHLIFCHPLFLLPPLFPSIKVFSNESALHIRWPKYQNFSFNISPSSEYPGLISFGMDWLDLLAVQGSLKSLLQHHRSKASIHWCSAFFIVQFSYPYMTAGKTITWLDGSLLSK